MVEDAALNTIKAARVVGRQAVCQVSQWIGLTGLRTVQKQVHHRRTILNPLAPQASLSEPEGFFCLLGLVWMMRL